MKKMRFVLVFMVLLTLLVMGLPVSAGQAGSGTSYIYVQNADSTENAQVAAQFYNNDGSSAGSLNVADLPPYVGYSINLSSVSPALPSTWQGNAVLSSNRQLAAVGRTIYTSAPTADGITAGEYTAMAAPDTTSYLAYVWNHVSRNTTFSIQNTDGSDATVYIHYIHRASGEVTGDVTECSGSAIVDTIDGNGVVYYDLLNQTRNGVYSGGVGGKIPCQSYDGLDQPAAGTAGFFDGSIYITSTTNIAVAADTYWTQYEGVYTGATEDDTVLYYPQVVRHKKPTGGEWVRWSAMLVQNTQDFPIDITVEMVGASGSVVFSDTLPALSGKDYNTRYRGDFPSSVWTNCTSTGAIQPACAMEQQMGTYAWTGAAKITVNTPGGRIVGVGMVMYNAFHEFSHEAMGPSMGTQTVVCPIMWDHSADGRYSNIIVQSGSSSPATVDLYVFKQGNTTGGTAGADLTLNNGGSGYVVPAEEHIEANTRYSTPYGFSASDFDPLGNNWDGTVIIVSRDEPIMAAVSNFRLDIGAGELWSTTYNCYNLP